MVCLDTSILIDYLKGEKGVVSLINSYANEEKLSTTVISEYELLKHSDTIKREMAEEFLSAMKIYPLDRHAVEEASKIYRNLKAQGKMANENDILIAGISLSNGQLLLTRDGGFKAMADNDMVKVV